MHWIICIIYIDGSSGLHKAASSAKMPSEATALEATDLAGVGLSDVLQHVPELLDQLPLSARTALLHTSRALRKQLQCSVRLIQPVSQAEARLLLHGCWPCLETIDISGIALPAKSILELTKQSLPCLETLQLSCPGMNDAAVAQLATGNWPKLHTLVIHNATLGSAAISALSTTSWPLMQELRLYSLQVTPDTPTFQGAFPLLKTVVLDFSGSSHSAAVLNRVMEIITASSWEKLEVLDISYSNFDAAAAAYLMALGDWPRLKSLRLQLTCSDSAIMQLATTRWPMLEDLDATCVFHSGDVMQHVDHMTWPQLKVLTLRAMGLYSTSIFQAAQSSWALLHTLDLSSNALSTAAMENLVTANLPLLQHLDLSLCGLHAVAMQPLTNVKWPLLQKLFLDDNDLDTAAMQYLTAAACPKLELLELGMNGLDGFAMAVLVKGDWRELRVLGLCKSCPKEGVAHLLQGNWPKLEILVLSYNHLDVQAVAALSLGNWPQLKTLRLSHCALDAMTVSYLVRGKWRQLSVLHLCYNGLDLGSAVELLKGDWPVLAELNLAENVMNAAAVDELCKGKWPCLKKLELTNICARGRARASYVFGGLYQQNGVLSVSPLDSAIWLYLSPLLYAGCWPFLRNIDPCD